MLKLISKVEKKEVLNVLQKLIESFKKKKNNEMWWHSQRILYSIKHELVPQEVYVDQFPNFNYIISKYTNKDNGKNFEVYTKSENDNSLIKDACDQVISMMTIEDISYGQIQSSPLYLHSFLKDSVRKNKLNIFAEVAANGMTFPYENIDVLLKGICPIKGYFCRPLTENVAELVNNRLKYAQHPDTYKWIKKTITTLPNMGCWNNKGELVGQFMIMESGNIGGLYVIDECKGLKLGKWIVQEMTKYLHSIDFPMVLETEFSNKVSYSLFTGLGFKKMAHSYYLLLSKDSEIKEDI